jgi:small GTP-binding protein
MPANATPESTISMLNTSTGSSCQSDVQRSRCQSDAQMAERVHDKFSVAVMGRSSVGKSSITMRYTTNRFVSDYDPTIEDLHIKQTTIAGGNVSVSILDTAGQEPLCSYRRDWMRHQSGFLFVFSLIDRQTFDELNLFYDELMDLYNDDPPPSVLVANKSDFEERQWVVDREEVKQLHSEWRNCKEVIYTSAKSNMNITDAFECICLAIHERAEAQRERKARQVRQQADATVKGQLVSPRSSAAGSREHLVTNEERGHICERCRDQCNIL